MDKAAMLAEAYSRGLLPPDRKAIYEEAMGRGLVAKAPAGQAKIDAQRRVASTSPGVRAVSQGVSAGFSDDFDALSAAAETGVGNIVKRVQGKTPAYGMRDAYHAVMAAEKEAGDKFAKEHPVLNIGAQIGGGLAMPGVGAASRFIGGARGLPAAAMRSGIVGAGYGAVTGAGMASGGIEDRAQGAGSGAVFGATLGAATPVAGRLAQNTGRAIMGRVAPQADDVGRAVLRKATKKQSPGEMRAKAEELRAAGVDPTLTDVAGERGRRFIRAVGVKSPDAGEVLVNRARTVGASTKPAIMDRTRKMVDDPRTATVFADDLATARDTAAKTEYAPAYATMVGMSDDVSGVLTDAPGRAVLRSARADALERRDHAQVAEIDALLNKANPAADDVARRVAGVDAPQAPAPLEDPRGISLATFIRQRGGIRDDGGELASRDWARSKGKFQEGWLTNPNGRSLDDLAHQAWEDGFFPDVKLPGGANVSDNYSPVTGKMLIDALEREAKGGPTPSWLQDQDFAASTRWMDDSDVNIPDLDWASLEGRAQSGGDVSAATLHRARIALRERGNKFSRAGNSARASGSYGRQGVIDDALEAVPEMGPANANYKANSQGIDVIGKPGFRPDMFSTDPSDYATWLGKMSPQARDANRIAIRQEILDTLGGQRSSTMGSVDELATSQYARENLRHAFGDEGSAAYLKNLEARLEQIRNARFVSPNDGSRTAVLDNDLQGVVKAMEVGGQAVQGKWLSIGINYLKTRGVSEADARQLVEMASDPKRLDAALKAIEARAGPKTAESFVNLRRAVTRAGVSGSAVGAGNNSAARDY